MSFYVKRERGDRIGWTGPIRSEQQVEREAQAWRDMDLGWTATVLQSTSAVRAEIREWERNKRNSA